jgi:hypothetical protein
MNRITKKMGAGFSGQMAVWRRLSRGAFTMLAIASLIFATAAANASCATGIGSKSPIKLPMLGQLGNALGDDFAPSSSESIVGLWHVVYTSGGQTFNESFDEWHSDGTEFENVYLAPDVGNICFGVWKPVGLRTVRLHHIGWSFTPGSAPGTATGTFTLDETNTVSRDGKTYTGNFTFKTFDLNGVQGADVTGTIAATRISVD